ncbi:MAG: HI0074 family nucleotidyltransferase substrate-binding subunit [Lachnospiraceae bacterium]
MESRYINRYNTFCKSLNHLAKSRNADPDADFVLEGTVQNYNLTFDISWKVMKDLLTKHFEMIDFAMGSPREVLKKSFSVGLIEDDIWLEMLKIRNQLAHDYDGSLAKKEFDSITHEFYAVLVKFKNKVAQYYCVENKGVE